MSDGRVEFEIRADNSDVSNKITDTTNKLKSAAGEWESSTQSASNSSSMFAGVLQGVGQALTGAIVSAAANAGKAIVQFGKECIAAASSLEETKNVVDTVFGDNASQIYRWAEAAQSAFGLTQTQALRYTSTLGAMMKSSGLAQNEITEMSTALAGLAADMASFYNMDFDTAFDKIRSGISGETEPLKQLGINLSVANLEAFALAQGIKKAYSEMSQAEQVALRYQYIMQATANAQGDFQRTSDGYANSVRRIQTAWENIKTSIGGVLLDLIQPAVTEVASFMEALTADPPKTLFEKIQDINVSYEKQVVEIGKVHDQARTLVDTLQGLHDAAKVTDVSGNMAQLIESLSKDIPGLFDAIKGKDPTAQIKELAGALSVKTGVSMEAWTVALENYGKFAGDLKKAMDADDPTAEINALAEALAKSTGVKADDWKKILTTMGEALKGSGVSESAETMSGAIEALAKSIPGLYEKIQGKDPSEQIGELAGALEKGSNVSADAWTEAITHYEEFAGALSDAMASDDPTGKIRELAEQLSKSSDINVGEWETILTQFGNALKVSGVSENAPTFTNLVDGLTTKLPGLYEAINGKDPTSQISGLAGALAEGSGISLDAWTTALTNFDSFSGQLYAAMTSTDPTGKIKELAEALSPGTDISVGDWEKILGTFADALSTSNVKTEAAETGRSISDLVAAFAQEKDVKIADLTGMTEGSGQIVQKLNEVTESAGNMLTSMGKVRDADVKSALDKVNADAGSASNTNIKTWETVLGAFSANFSGFKEGLDKYSGENTTKIKNLASALSGIDGDTAKVEAWKTLIGLLSQDVSGIAEAMDWSEEEVTGWLNALTEQVNNIDPNKADAFDKLFETLMGGGNINVTGAAGAASELEGLAGSMDSVYYASEEELIVLRKLVELFPELASIVNTTTGEVKGGYEALMQFIDASEDAALKLAAQKKIQAELDVLAERKSYVTEWRVTVKLNEYEIGRATEKIDKYKEVLDRFRTQYGEGGYATHSALGQGIGIDGFERDGIKTLADLENAYNAALNARERYTAENDKLVDNIAEEDAAIAAVTEKIQEEAVALGVNAESTDDAASAAERLAMEENAASKAISSLKKELESIIKYQENARKEAVSSLSQVVSGFKEVDRASKEYAASMSAGTMNKNLDDQLKFLDEYSKLIDQLHAKGVSQEIIGNIADGSMESMQYMRGLATATESEIETLNKKWETVQSKKSNLADKVAAERLAVDTEYQAMIDMALKAALAMDQSATAGEGAAATMSAIVGAVAAGRESLAGEVEAVNALIAQLGHIGQFTVGGNIGGVIGYTGGHQVGHDNEYYTPLAIGMDYVPVNGFLAELHEGEAVLTPDEAAIWRNFTGMTEAVGQQAFDYDLLTSSITNGMPSQNGNVYLDGQTVGRVISANMGNSYRRLERSGWRG